MTGTLDIKENDLKGVPCDTRKKNKLNHINLIIVNLSNISKKYYGKYKFTGR